MSAARERILDAAYDLFSRHGVKAVGVDRIVAESGVAKMTLYRHFSSKDDLVIAFLERREERWTNAWLRAEVESRGSTGSERLLAIFDVFDEWFRRPGFEGCSFINVLLEFDDPAHPVRKASVVHLANIRSFLSGARGGRRGGRPGRIRTPVARADEGLDRRGRRGRQLGGPAGAGAGGAAAGERGGAEPGVSR